MSTVLYIVAYGSQSLNDVTHFYFNGIINVKESRAFAVISAKSIIFAEKQNYHE